MRVSYEYLGFIDKDEMHIEKIGESSFIILPPQYGMFYILPGITLNINLECKFCKATREVENEATLMVGNGTIMGTIECSLCNSYSLIMFHKKTIMKLIDEMRINPNLIKEHWGYASSLSNN